MGEGMATILVADDDPDIAELVEIHLAEDGFRVYKAYDGREALQVFAREKIDLAILDIMMPGIDGIRVCEKIREVSMIPVIMLSAKDSEADKVAGLGIGADDYVTKPFDIKEVTARVEVQIRRAETTGRKEEEHRFTYQELELNKGDFTVKVGNTELPHITKQEFSILELLLKHPKKVFSKEEMFEYAWEEQYMGETKTLDVHISNIRKKIKAVTDKEYIETVWGIGYRLHP